MSESSVWLVKGQETAISGISISGLLCTHLVSTTSRYTQCAPLNSSGNPPGNLECGTDLLNLGLYARHSGTVGKTPLYHRISECSDHSHCTWLGGIFCECTGPSPAPRSQKAHSRPPPHLLLLRSHSCWLLPRSTADQLGT